MSALRPLPFLVLFLIGWASVAPLSRSPHSQSFSYTPGAVPPVHPKGEPYFTPPFFSTGR